MKPLNQWSLTALSGLFTAIAALALSVILFLGYLIIFDIPRTEARADTLQERVNTLQQEAQLYDLSQPQYADIRTLIKGDK